MSLRRGFLALLASLVLLASLTLVIGCSDDGDADCVQATNLAAAYDSSTYKYGYIDKEGNMVIAQQFDQARPFSEGLAAVTLLTEPEGNLTGFIDETGKFVIEPQYLFTSDFSEGLAAASRFNPDWGKDTDNESMEEYGFIDASGKIVIEFDYALAGPFFDELAHVMLSNPGLSGYIDREGNMVIEPRFDQAHSFSEGLAVFGDWSENDGTYDVKCGYINKAGEVVAEARFDVAGTFHEGLAQVGVEQPDGGCLYGFMDKNFNIVIEPRFTEAGDFCEGYAMVQTGEGGGETFIDKTGRFLTTERYHSNLDASEGYGCSDFSEGLAAVCRNGKWGYIDRSGNMVIPPIFNMAGKFKDGLAPVQ